MNTNIKEFENLSVEKFGPVSTCLCPKYIICCFQNFVNIREDENERNRLLLVLKMKKKINCSNYTVFIDVS